MGNIQFLGNETTGYKILFTDDGKIAMNRDCCCGRACDYCSANDIADEYDVTLSGYTDLVPGGPFGYGICGAAPDIYDLEPDPTFHSDINGTYRVTNREGCFLSYTFPERKCLIYEKYWPFHFSDGVQMHKLYLALGYTLPGHGAPPEISSYPNWGQVLLTMTQLGRYAASGVSADIFASLGTDLPLDCGGMTNVVFHPTYYLSYGNHGAPQSIRNSGKLAIVTAIQ